ELEGLAVDRHAPGRAVARERRGAALELRSRRARQRLVAGGAVRRRVRGGIGLGDRLVLRIGLVAVAWHVVAQRLAEDRLRGAQRDPILRALGAGQARFDRRQVELDLVREGRLLGALVVPETLFLGIRLDQRE